MAQRMTIGGLAKAAGVNVETVRYYQRRGLISEPRKPLGGQRTYADSAAAELAFIRRAQELGFTLADIKALQGLAAAGRARDARAIAETRHAQLALHARQLQAMATRLKGLIERSRRSRAAGTDPLMAALQKRDGAAHPARP